jgi:hypothetical protein
VLREPVLDAKENVLRYDKPLPGMPTPADKPRGPKAVEAPRPPIERPSPDLDKFSESPLAIFILLENRKPIFTSPLHNYTFFSIVETIGNLLANLV